MMAGFAITRLRHGKALCGKVFRSFVETFNWHSDFCENLRGDGDSPGSSGKIRVDRTDPHRPIVRFVDSPAAPNAAISNIWYDAENHQLKFSRASGEEVVVFTAVPHSQAD